MRSFLRDFWRGEGGLGDSCLFTDTSKYQAEGVGDDGCDVDDDYDDDDYDEDDDDEDDDDDDDDNNCNYDGELRHYLHLWMGGN